MRVLRNAIQYLVWSNMSNMDNKLYYLGVQSGKETNRVESFSFYVALELTKKVSHYCIGWDRCDRLYG